MVEQAPRLASPQEYEEHHEVFSASIDELHGAAGLGYALAADPVGAASSFDEYDSRVREASALLEQSNELLGKDYATLEEVGEISPAF